MILPELGIEGQRRLSTARVLCVGAGGLGCPALLYLAGAGLGHIGIVDNDRVDEGNLQRQVLYTMEDLGRPKVEAARERLLAFNPKIEITAHNTRLTAENAEKLISLYDIIIDGSDNFETKFLLNDVCVVSGKALVSGSVLRFEGQVGVFDSRSGPCYRCLFPAPPAPEAGGSCVAAGVLGVVPGIIGVIQATEAIKLILGVGQTLLGKLLVMDARSMSFRELQLSKDENCPCCGDGIASEPPPLATTQQGDRAMTETVCISATELKKRLDAGEKLVIVDVREPDEFATCKIPGAILVPLQTLPERFGELDRNATLVLQCHHGRRSLMALEFLRDRGFTNLINLTGGIDAWSCEVDPGVPRY